MKQEKLKCGGVRKFIVVPVEFMKDPYWEEALLELQDDISKVRASKGKDPNPEYIVINTDEPYIQEIIDVLKKNGHWG